MEWCPDCGKYVEHTTAGPVCGHNTPPITITQSAPGIALAATPTTGAVRLECIRELGYAIIYMNYLNPWRGVDAPFKPDRWHDQRLRVQALCEELSKRQDDPSLEYWQGLRSRITDEIENMC